MKTLCQLFAVVVLTILEVSIVYGATLDTNPPTWSGAGPNACNGNCSQEWAESNLTIKEQNDLYEARLDQTETSYIRINDGDVFNGVSYYKDGEPHFYRTKTIADLNEPKNAFGWNMGTWSWVQLEDCTNWTIVSNQKHTPYIETQYIDNPQYSGYYPNSGLGYYDGFGSNQWFTDGSSGGEVNESFFTTKNKKTVNHNHHTKNVTKNIYKIDDPKKPPIAPVPLPASLLLSLIGISALILAKRISK